MTSIKRRDFLTNSLGGAAALSVLPAHKTVSANDRIVVGVMGVGGRGTDLVELFARMPEVELAYLCDVNERRFERALERVEPYQKKAPEMVKDFRRILDDPRVNALVNATPDHWHGLGTILACQAGKDVYVEKPLSHNIFEGKKMIEAARKYKRVVQVGTQTRSSDYAKKAVKYIRGGHLGDIRLVRVTNQMRHPPREKGPPEPVPDGFDWDMWCGPAPRVPYSPGRWWLERWDYSVGGIPGDAIHQLDLARMLVGVGYPSSVYHAGGVEFFHDGREAPDTQIATFEFDQLTLTFVGTLWTPYMKKTPSSIRDADKFPGWPFNSTKIEVFGTRGFMNCGRHGGGWQAYDENGELMKSEYGRPGNSAHLKNFIECIRTRQNPAADVEDGHASALLCHMANISYRVGNRKLEFDPQSQTFIHDEEANKYLKRDYRHPWVVPDTV